MKTTVKVNKKEISIKNIYCIGKNYEKHAKELNSVIPEEPLVFLKPTSSIIFNKETIILPKKSSDIHHEVEIVILIGKNGKNIIEEKALEYILGYGIGIDVTARDLQSEARKKGFPWTVAKGFHTFCPVSDFVPANKISQPNDINFSLLINEKIKQSGNTKDMVYPLVKIICFLSNIFTLQEGDLIFTGTPEGVGPIHDGDQILAHSPELNLNLEVVAMKEV